MTTLNAKYKPYPAYRPSGVEWLGEIPAHWEIKRLKFLAQIRYGLGQPPKESPNGLPLIRATNINRGRITDVDMLYVDPVGVPSRRGAFLSAQEIIVVRSGAYTADSAIVLEEYEGAIAGYDMVVTAREAAPEFLAISFLSPYIRDAQLVVASTRSAQPHLNAEELGDAEIILPPLSEQRAIAAFLDRETARSDALVSREERLIELLREKRTALITRAVTRGLDPNAPLRDSGVEWLGEIPIHWETTKLRRLLTLVSHHVDVHPEQSYQEIGIRSWGRGIFHKDSVTGAQLGDKRVFKLRPGELVLNIVFAWEGAVAIVSESEKDMIASHRFPTFQHPRHLVDLDYLLMFLQSEHGRGIMGLNSPGAAGRNRTIRMDSFLEEEVPLPPLEEQREIVTIFRRDERRIQSLAGKVREAVDLLKELRTALITAAVTGRIDVREEVG